MSCVFLLQDGEKHQMPLMMVLLKPALSGAVSRLSSCYVYFSCSSSKRFLVSVPSAVAKIWNRNWEFRRLLRLYDTVVFRLIIFMGSTESELGVKFSHVGVISACTIDYLRLNRRNRSDSSRQSNQEMGVAKQPEEPILNSNGWCQNECSCIYSSVVNISTKKGIWNHGAEDSWITNMLPKQLKELAKKERVNGGNQGSGSMTNFLAFSWYQRAWHVQLRVL